MTRRVWHKGPPPHVGWWNARLALLSCEDKWGWWDGKGWSTFAYLSLSADQVGGRASEKGAIYSGPGVEWCDYWPENARVPRVKP